MSGIRLELDASALSALADAVAERVVARMAGGGEVPVHQGPLRPLSLKEVSTRLGVSQTTARRWVADGRLRRLPGCRKVLVPAEDVDWLARGE
jgi:excisionase family DNA binding protein